MHSASPALPAVSPGDRADSCRRLTGRVVAIKRILIERYRLQGVPMNFIREAIATAEAEAWLSGFPHLFLPDLADEMLRRLLQNVHPEYAQAA